MRSAEMWARFGGVLLLGPGLAGLMIGCAYVDVSGRYAVRAYDAETGSPASPRVVVAFYDVREDRRSLYGSPGEGKRYWATAVGPNAASEGIVYPPESYWDWGTLVLALPVHTHYVFPGVCILADGYWPFIQNTNIGQDEPDLPRARASGLRGEGWAQLPDGDSLVPDGCDAVWQASLISVDKAYDQRVARSTLAAAAGLLPTLDAALESSENLTADEKRWAYAQLLLVINAQLNVAADPSDKADLTAWAQRFEERAHGVSGAAPPQTDTETD